MSLMTITQLVIAFALGSPLGALLITIVSAKFLDAPAGVEALIGSALAVSMVICGILMIKNVRPLR